MVKLMLTRTMGLLTARIVQNEGRMKGLAFVLDPDG